MNKDLLLKNKFVIIIVVAVFCSVLFFFSFRFFTPFGAVVKYQFISMFDRDKLSKLKGAEETSSFNPTQAGVLQIPQQTIRQNAVTFNLKLITKPIEGVWVNLRFKGNPKEIKIGVRGSEKENYQYQPLYNRILNFMSWSQVFNGETTLWQREKKYKDLSDFASKPPISTEPKVASYFFDPANLNLFKNKTTSSSVSKKNLIIDRTLRGSHTFYVQANTKPFIVNIEKQDGNGYKGEDVLLIELYKGDHRIVKKEIPDDGITEVSNLKMKPQAEQIKIDNLEPGIYRLVLTDESKTMDVLIKKIETNQSILVFSSPIYILDEKPSRLWTNSKKITMTTWHKENLQVVKLDNRYDLDIQKKDELYKFDLDHPLNTSSFEIKTSTLSAGKQGVDNTRELHELDIPKNDLIITGDGYFASSQDAFFNPESIKSIDLSKVTELDKIDYVITNYQLAKKEPSSEWYTAQAYFDPKDIKIDGDKLYFSLESPDLSSYGGEIVIDNLEVTVKKPGWIKTVSPTSKIIEVKNALNLWQKITNFFKNFFPKKIKVSQTTAEPSPTSEPTPTPDPRATISIVVYNSGAGKGAAGRFADILNNAGFTEAVATNAATFDTKNASVSYNVKDAETEKGFIEEIVTLLKKDYDTVKEDSQAKETGVIKVILGENPKEMTPPLLPAKSGSAGQATMTPKPTAKPTP